MATDTFSIGDALLFGWNKFKDNAVFLLLLGLGLGIATFIANSMQKATIGLPLLFVITYLIIIVINAVVSFIFVTASLELHDYGTIEFDDLTKTFPQFIQYLVGYVIFGVAIVIGFFLLIVPGIFLSVKLFLYMYLVVDKKMNGIDALKLSYEMTTGHFLELFLFLLCVVVLNILGVLLFGLGLLVTIPVTSIATAYVYRKLAQKTLP